MGFWDGVKKVGKGVGKVVTGDDVAKKLGKGLGIIDDGSAAQAKKASALIEAMDSTDFKDTKLERYKSAGDARDFISDQVGTEFDQIAEDPAMREAQLRALGQLDNIASSDGITETDMARLDQIGREEANRERGQREAILRNAQARGVAGGGTELAAQLAAQQGSADRAAMRGTNVNAQAADRALSAAIQGGNLGGNVRSQDFSQASQRASAQDAINRFNSVNQSQAGMAQFQNQQNIANNNTGIANQEKVDLQQQQYNNDLALAQARANALNKVGSATAAQTARFTDFLGKAAGAAAKGGA